MSKLIDRFMAKVSPEPNSGCWLWDGAHIPSRNRRGYAWPVIWVDGMHRKASRVGWALLCGPIPDGLSVLHRCDNPSCVNPEHLYTGTQADNVADAARRGRHRGNKTRGERHHRAKLTGEQVAFIRSSALPAVEIARQWGFNANHIREVRRGVSRAEG